MATGVIQVCPLGSTEVCFREQKGACGLSRPVRSANVLARCVTSPSEGVWFVCVPRATNDVVGVRFVNDLVFSLATEASLNIR